MQLGKQGRKLFVVHMVTVLIIMTFAVSKVTANQPISFEEQTNQLVCESIQSRDISFIGTEERVVEYEVLELTIAEPEPVYNWSEEEQYMLAKIAMCEAEGESIETKMLVIATIINRVESSGFPDSISEVIFENNGRCYQFSPVMPNHSWWYKEPNEECYRAVELVALGGVDSSSGCLYFESCDDEDNWHSRNLEYLFQSDDMRFYK